MFTLDRRAATAYLAGTRRRHHGLPDDSAAPRKTPPRILSRLGRPPHWPSARTGTRDGWTPTRWAS